MTYALRENRSSTCHRANFPCQRVLDDKIYYVRGNSVGTVLVVSAFFSAGTKLHTKSLRVLEIVVKCRHKLRKSKLFFLVNVFFIIIRESVVSAKNPKSKSESFNMSNKHYFEEELKKIITDPNYTVLYLAANDKYGDLGIVGLTVLNKLTNVIEAFSLSCRVFDRDFENLLINNLKEYCGSEIIYGLYVFNQKNGRFANFYTNHGIVVINSN